MPWWIQVVEHSTHQQSIMIKNRFFLSFWVTLGFFLFPEGPNKSYFYPTRIEKRNIFPQFCLRKQRESKKMPPKVKSQLIFHCFRQIYWNFHPDSASSFSATPRLTKKLFHIFREWRSTSSTPRKHYWPRVSNSSPGKMLEHFFFNNLNNFETKISFFLPKIFLFP